MRSALIAIIMLLCACAPVAPASTTVEADRVAAAEPAEKPDRLPVNDTCGRSRFGDLIGHPASSIDHSRLPANTRIICHNCAATMDMAPDRLNILLDQRGNVSELRCG